MELSAFIISLVAVIIATASTVISYLIFRDTKDPEVVVYATPDERRPSIVNIVIDNIGNSPAWDVQFKSSIPIPFRAFGIENAPQPEVMDGGPLINGIPSLGPGSKRVITWGQFDGIRKGIGDGYLDIAAVYFSKPSLALRPRKHKSISRLDIRSFEYSDVSDHNWDKKIAEELKKISDVIRRVRSIPENAIRILPVDKHNDKEEIP
jgi:hypothetical protein